MAVKTSHTLPDGWRVELLGIINGVEFTIGTTSLLWSDGHWTMTSRGLSMSVAGIAKASTQAEARKIGTAFIQKCYSDD